jgi:hypothetical protein
LAAQCIRGVFNLYIPQVSTTNAEEPEESDTGVPIAKEVDGRRRRVRRYHNGRCKDSLGDLFGRLPHVRSLSSNAEVTCLPLHQHLN